MIEVDASTISLVVLVVVIELEERESLIDGIDGGGLFRLPARRALLSWPSCGR